MTPQQTTEASQAAYAALRQSLNQYATISDDTWKAFRPLCRYRELSARALLYSVGQHPDSFSYVFTGLFRVFISDAQGNEYNKNFFAEGSFPGCMTALLTGEPSQFSVQALEPVQIIEIDFNGYRALLDSNIELMRFQIRYLEQHWLQAKDTREVEIVQQGASQRYRSFLRQYPDLHRRLAQYHIASHLGITPTQLSRIRRNIL
ncbi:Crp/Fnr family transcriptional regulator [Lacimicrobium alkaliphilum]|uniref:Cyclic nucleotide-binding domain-containing protein n=1 Tax=Lacimicrobium alkaliphilum TaxID=1526571 RepID=A0ABQ1R4U2_9ALTE|nr:Crp/Fnr family transcriptional regulator [Lacimicrobium alkaliphilum]GGD54936.1 hypothetical protein GCM10011357_08340 [Lacimicrobium alkaliphilum]